MKRKKADETLLQGTHEEQIQSSRPTIGDVAKLAGVSISTVSRVINEKAHIATETKAKVLDALQKLGYEAGALQQLDYQPPASSENIQDLPLFIGVTSISMGREPYAEILAGVTEALHARKALPIICPIRYRHHYNMPLYERLSPNVTSGGLILGSAESNEEVDEAMKRGLPCVVICSDEVVSEDMPVVVSANWHGGKLATEHLIALGHRAIGMIMYHNPFAKNNVTSEQRFAGYQSAMLAEDLDIAPAWVYKSGDTDKAAGYQAGHYFLRLPQPPTAVIAYNDEVAAGLMQAVYEMGKAVPMDLSVVGFDDSSSAHILSPALTAIRQPYEEMGMVGVETLFRMIAGEALAVSRIELSARLVTRASTAPLMSKA